MFHERVKPLSSAVGTWLGVTTIDVAGSVTGRGAGGAVTCGEQALIVRMIVDRVRGKVFFIVSPCG